MRIGLLLLVACTPATPPHADDEERTVIAGSVVGPQVGRDEAWTPVVDWDSITLEDSAGIRVYQLGQCFTRFPPGCDLYLPKPRSGFVLKMAKGHVIMRKLYTEARTDLVISPRSEAAVRLAESGAVEDLGSIEGSLCCFRDQCVAPGVIVDGGDNACECDAGECRFCGYPTLPVCSNGCFAGGCSDAGKCVPKGTECSGGQATCVNGSCTACGHPNQPACP